MSSVDEVTDVRAGAVSDLVSELAQRVPAVVVDLGRGWRHPAVAALNRADRLVAVGAPSPVGVVRLLDWLAGTGGVWSGPADVVVNRAPRPRFQRGEVVDEVTRTYQPASFVFLPEDPAVTEAAWAARPVTRGRYRRGLERWADRYLVGRARR